MAWIWGLSAVTALLLWPLWQHLAPFLPRCAFHRLTGFACPTCGTTRAALALLAGHPLEALAFNPMMTIIGCTFVAGGVLAPIWSVARLPLPVMPPNAWKPLRIVAVLAVLLNWAYLILSGR